MDPRLRVRGMILTGAVAAITATGAYFGAGLKADREQKQMRKKVQTEEGVEDELIAALLTRKRALMQSKQQWEAKAETLRQRVESKQQAAK